MDPREPLIILDDDPTGAQSESGVQIALEWSPELLAALAARRPRAVHVLTNTRARSEEEARAVTGAAAEASARAFPRSRIVLRGDSTLRAHLLPEYLGLRDAVFPGRVPVLMLVPALPAAGRVTEGGVHYIERDGVRTPLDQTEYARDPSFGYGSARLLDWAEERSAGFFPAAAGRETLLAELRGRGPSAVAERLVELAGRGLPAALAVDSTTNGDLELVAEGVRRAEAAGADVVVRAAPAFVAILSGAVADRYQAPPVARTSLLVICGSHVPASSRQLASLARRLPEGVVWVSPQELAGERRAEAVSTAVAEARERLERSGTAVVATSRRVFENGDGLRSGASIASGMAAILAGLRDRVDVVISKGGITSAINAREGLGGEFAEVLGPLRDGVSLWSVETPEREAMPFIVFPGNVGSDEELADLVEEIRP